MNNAQITLNLSKDVTPSGDDIVIAQGDKHGITITATIYDGKNEAALTGYTAYLVVQLPDRRHYYKEAATVSGSTVTATIDESKLATVSGETSIAYFTLTNADNTATYSTARFGMRILPDGVSQQSAAKTYDSQVETAIANANAAAELATKAAESTSGSEIKADAAEAKTLAQQAQTTAAEASTAALTAQSTAEAASTAARTAQTTADSKADKAHTHAIADVTGLQAALDAASSSGSSSGGTTYTAGNGIEISPDNVISTPLYDGAGYTLGTRKSGSNVGKESVAEGFLPIASGKYSHAEARYPTASGNFSHAEGDVTIASGEYSHAEGEYTKASEIYSHAEGSGTVALGGYSHAEGSGTVAIGYASHTEGKGTRTSRNYAHAEGFGTQATVEAQHVCGTYNAIDPSALFIVGNGTESKASNALAVHKDGDIVPGAITTISTMLYPVGAVICGTSAMSTSTLGGTWTSIGTQTIGGAEITYYQRTA